MASPSEAIGGIGLWLQQDVRRRSAEIGYWLGEPFWGRGIASAALRALTEYAFARFDLVRLYGCVYEWNPASAQVMEKAGYACEGRLRKSAVKDGQVIDPVLVCHYPLNPPHPNPLPRWEEGTRWAAESGCSLAVDGAGDEQVVQVRLAQGLADSLLDLGRWAALAANQLGHVSRG